MKRTLIGCWLTLLGTLWGGGILMAASQQLVTSWYGNRLLATIKELGLAVPFVLAAAFLIGGLAIMTVEYFQK